MKIILFRTDPSIMKIDSYNSQEIGLAKAYIKLGHQCDIIYYNGKNKSYVQKIEVDNYIITIYWMKGFSIFNNGFFPGVKKIIDQYDMIQVSEYYQFMSWYVYKHYSQEKKVYVYQGVYDSDNSKKFNLRCKIMDPLLLSKKILNDTKIFTKSHLSYLAMKKRGFVNVKTVGVGMDLSRLEECNVLKPDIDLNEDYKYITYIGKIEDRRNILFLIDVFKNVTENVPDVKLLLIGNGDNNYKGKVFSLIEKYDLKKSIIYIENIPQNKIGYIYKHSYLFILPTKYEIFGMVIMEAMSYGVPVITSYNGGSSTIINNNINGIIINNFVIEDWKNAIIELLENDNLRLEISKEAKNSSKKNFSWVEIAKIILNEMEDDYL